MIEEILLKIHTFFSFLKGSRVTFIIFLEIALGFFVTISSAIIFIKLRSEVLDRELIPFDHYIAHFFYSLRSPALNEVMIFVTYFGGILVTILGIVITILLTIRNHKREAFLFGYILTMAIILNVILKNLTLRDRPQFLPLVTENGYSFPSGHAMNSFVFYISLAYFMYHFTKNRALTIVCSLIALFAIGLIGMSRIYLGVHYPTDVLAGWAGGMTWFASVLVLEKTSDFYHLFRHNKET